MSIRPYLLSSFVAAFALVAGLAILPAGGGAVGSSSALADDDHGHSHDDGYDDDQSHDDADDHGHSHDDGYDQGHSHDDVDDNGPGAPTTGTGIAGSDASAGSNSSLMYGGLALMALASIVAGTTLGIRRKAGEN